METGVQRKGGRHCLKTSRYIIGIDLGTTNSSLSYIDTEKTGHEIEIFTIPQLVDEGTIKGLKTLPSFLYLPGEHELPEEATAVPWDKNIPYIAGEFARLQGTRVPTNLVSSAKSWLCHNRVDRKAPILPWGKETSAKRISPVEASAYCLKHLKDSWNHVMAGGSNGLLEDQQIVITIPASFDESARELTAEAAELAGIKNFTMVEEPQAAFYAWLSSHKGDRHECAGRDRIILVFDVGGGTTDFTLISASIDKGTSSFQRVAVGDHIMLGGDNMDLALAKKIESDLMGPGRRFDFQQWLSAAHQCRTAKEELLGDTEKQVIPITVLGKGKSVIGGAGKVDLSAGEIRDIILDGFFKKVEIGEDVQKGRVSGLQELGLPFESDPAVMKHLSSFLKRHAANKDLKQVTDRKSGLNIVRPDILLFNGGVFRSPVIMEHVTAIIREWFADSEWSLSVLKNEQFEQAVSIGAAYYGLVLRGKGERISGGLGKAYYIAAEKACEYDKGLKNPVTLVCIVPRGKEEGEEIHLSEPEFQVMTNSPVSFAIYSSSYRAGDRAGDVIVAEKEEFIELPPVKTVLHFGKKAGSVKIPVSLGIKLNEYGTLDVWCESKTTTHRWKFAFQTRMVSEEDEKSIKREGTEKITLDETAVEQVMELIAKAFLSSGEKPSDVTPENLIKKMEAEFNLNRKSWPLFTIRKMWDSLLKVKDRRKVSPMHEARWLNLSGFLIRPGFGYQLDKWRMKELWKIFLEGPVFANSGLCKFEWWIMWRRTAGGLDSAKQDIIFRSISLWLLPSKKKRKKLSGAEVSEMWMLAASLEHLSPAIKQQLGDELVNNIRKWKGKSLEQYYWALSRIGARTPFHGPINRIVSREVAEKWIEAILESEWSTPKSAGYAVTQLARRTGDRTRDINKKLCDRIVDRLSQYTWSEHYIRQIQEVVPLEWEDEKKMFGESLPGGLYIEN